MKAKILIVLVVSIVLIGGGFLAWQRGSLSEMLFLQTKKQLTMDQIKNSEIYSNSFKEKAVLINGEYKGRYILGASPLSVNLDNKNIVLGDLNSDGINEVALIAYWWAGGSGTWAELAILKNKDDYPIFVTSKNLGDRTIINSLTIDSGVIILDMNIHGPDDAMCCPTLKKIAKYKLVNTNLVETIDETADWQTYKNDKYGFELRYPSLGTEYDFEYNSDQNLIQSKFLTIYIVDKNNLSISDKRGDFKYNPDTNKWLDADSGTESYLCSSISNLGLDAIPSYYYGNQMPNNYPREDIIITSKNFALIIYREAYDYKIETVKLQEKIVGTLRFLGDTKPIAPVCNLQDYRERFN